MGGIQGPVAFQRVVVAPNAYKGTLSARAASLAISTGVGRAWPGVACAEVPLADGGDGFLASLVDGREHEIVVLEVNGPLLEPVRAEVGWLNSSDGLTAVLELAGSDGLMLLPRPSPETAGRASTRGLGELLRMAGGRQPARILVGLGGSASTDGGAGLAGALGYRLLDRRGVPIPQGGLGLLEIDRIEPPADGPAWSGIEIVAACDVENPLLGPAGAASVFAPQKGADERTVALLEQGLARLVEVVARDLGVSGREGEPGMGAAGGAAFGLACFCQAQLTSGVGLVASVAGLDRELEEADLVITGEGRLDRTSLEGKVVGEVLGRARALGIPCLVLAGSAEAETVAQVQGRGAVVRITSSQGSGPPLPERAASELASAAAAACLELAGPRAARQ